jgi:hypothetical protein
MAKICTKEQILDVSHHLHQEGVVEYHNFFSIEVLELLRA